MATRDPKTIGGHLPQGPSLTRHQGGNEKRTLEYFDMMCRGYADHIMGKKLLSSLPGPLIAWPKEPEEGDG
jgi:hypothetical protein